MSKKPGSTNTKENSITKLAPRKDQYSKLPTRDNDDPQNRSDVKHGSSKISRDMINKLLKRLKTLRMKVHPIVFIIAFALTRYKLAHGQNPPRPPNIVINEVKISPEDKYIGNV